MNTSIKKSNLIRPDRLHSAFYFTSLLEEAYNSHLITDTEIEQIQLMSLELLAERTWRYTSGESSSVSIETAERIMHSNLYTIGLYLKSFDTPKDALLLLKEKSDNLQEAYHSGQEIVKQKIEASRHFHNIVMKHLINIDNYTYQMTLKDAIIGFFDLYNPDFSAQEIHITADYPLCNPVKDLIGIEFIQTYLEFAHYENIFCNYFSEHSIHHLLCGYHKHYSDLIFNIFEQVLTIAIGCILADQETLTLHIDAKSFEYLHKLLSQKSRFEIDISVKKAYEQLLFEMNLNDPSLLHYIEQSLPQIVSSIFHGIQLNTLKKVFYEPVFPQDNNDIHFTIGEKMDNEQYRQIIDEIISCRCLPDKIAIIMDQIQVFADLEDLLFDGELTEEEIMAVFKTLGDIELAVFVKRYSCNSPIDIENIRESEKMLRLCIGKYLNSLSKEKQFEILHLTSLLKINS